MKPVAYSYIRFSSEPQAWGDSRRRQTAAAARYARQNNLALDDGLTFQDLGVSAFRGRNSRTGALGAFLAAIEQGVIAPGSYLLVESFDRLSRDQILSAQALFLQIIQAGIYVATLIDGRLYSAQSINTNPYELLISLVSMMRANEESAHKSARLNATWKRKRARALVKPLTSRCPAWLRLNRTAGLFEVIDRKADIVRRIFGEALAGSGSDTIARGLNLDRIEVMSGLDPDDAHWHSASIGRILNSPAVMGTLIPHKVEYIEGRRISRPLSPICGYYPAIISETDFARAQAMRAQHRTWGSGNGQASNNIFARLARCPRCNGSMRHICCTKPYWRYMVCSRAIMKAGCVRRGVRYPELEDAFLDEIERIIEACPWPRTNDPATATRIRRISYRIATLDTERADLLRTVARVHSNRTRPLRAVQELDAELQNLKDERSDLRASEPHTGTVHLERRLEELRSAAMSYDMDRRRVNAALRALFSGIVIDYERGTLTLTWHHGGRTRVKVNPDIMAIQNGWKATALVPAMRRLRRWKPHGQRRSDINAASPVSPPAPAGRRA